MAMKGEDVLSTFFTTTPAKAASSAATRHARGRSLCIFFAEDSQHPWQFG
jgi:ATP-dependent Clp protease adapter protein ClpS